MRAGHLHRIAALSSLTLPLLVAAAGEAAAGSDIERARADTLKLIELLTNQGVISRDNAAALTQEVARPAASADKPMAAATAMATVAPSAPVVPPGTVRVPYVPDFVRKDIKDELRTELVAQATREGWAGPGVVPEWVRMIRWDGDLRFRYQFDRYAADNAPAISVQQTNVNRAFTALNTTEDRQRLRVRARLGATATLDENWSAGARLATGNLTEPVSSNQTLGNYGNKFSATFDRAFIRYRYQDQINAVVGRFASPWMSTDLLWATDLGFDGVAVSWTPALPRQARGFVTLAAMPVQEVELSSPDKWLVGAQAGAELPGGPGGIDSKFAIALYDYRNMLGKVSPAGTTLYESSAPQFAQKGNTYYNISSDPARPLLGLAAEYRLLNLTGQMEIPVSGDKRVLISGDFVRNLAFDSAAVSQRVGTNVAARTLGYQLRLAFGDRELTRRDQWQVFATYKHAERDAVLDAFTDSDFRLGGTDARGYTIGGSYGVGRNTSLNLRYLSADSIDGPPLSIDVLQLDLIARF